MCCPIPRQPGHPAVRPYLSKMFCRKYTHRCGQASRQKLLASISCSTWLHPQNGFAPSTLLQMAPLLQRSPCPGQNDEAFSQSSSLGKCLRLMHSVEPSSPSTHDQVQFLSCISLRRLLEMPEAVPELSNSLVVDAPSSLSSSLELQSPSKSWIDIVWSKHLPHQECLAPGHISILPSPVPIDRCNFENSASHNRPIHPFSVPQQQKSIHELSLSQPSSKSSCWDDQACLSRTRNQTQLQECVPHFPAVWCAFRRGSCS